MKDVKLYHAQLGMPGFAKEAAYIGDLKYTRHAISEAKSDRYGRFFLKLPKIFDGTGELVEAEVVNGEVIKQVWRVPLKDDLNDLVMAITRDGCVKTVWLNRKTDTHRTLDEARYSKT